LPRNNKDIRLQPRMPQQCLRPALGFRPCHYKEEVLIIAVYGRKQIVSSDSHFSRNVIDAKQSVKNLWLYLAEKTRKVILDRYL